MKKSISKIICCFGLTILLAQPVFAQWELTEKQKQEIESRPKAPESIRQEILAMIGEINHNTSPYRMAVAQKMLGEANYFTDRLKLPTSHPIRPVDIQYPRISSPWFSVICKKYPDSEDFWWFGEWPSTSLTTNVYNTEIPRESRLRALQIGATGTIETTNFQFCFRQGKLLEVMRLGEHDVEYYAHDLDKLVGKPTLIDSNGAYQLATQWLTAVDVDVAALEKQFPHSVSQLSYQPKGKTNSVLLPLFFVAFGTNNVEHFGNMPVTYDPAAEVEILGTTKELQDLNIARNSNYAPYDHRPPLLITNVLDLIHTPSAILK